MTKKKIELDKGLVANYQMGEEKAIATITKIVLNRSKYLAQKIGNVFCVSPEDLVHEAWVYTTMLIYKLDANKPEHINTLNSKISNAIRKAMFTYAGKTYNITAKEAEFYFNVQKLSPEDEIVMSKEPLDKYNDIYSRINRVSFQNVKEEDLIIDGIEDVISLLGESGCMVFVQK